MSGDVTIIENIDITSEDVGTKLASALAGITIDVLVNNAGSYNATRELEGMAGFQEQALTNIPISRMMAAFDLNTLGVLRIVQAVLPFLNKEKSKICVLSTGMGSIADNTSGGSYAYRCSKAATNMMCKGMSVDLLKQNVAVVAVNPGMVATDFGPGKEAMAKMGGMPVSQSCSGLVQIFDELSLENTGRFMSVHKEQGPMEYAKGW